MESNGMESSRVERNGVESSGKDLSPASKPKISQPPASAPSAQSQPAQTPVRTSTGEPVTWAEAAEAMKSLKVSRIGAAIEAAKANDFAPPAVLALVEVLRHVPSDQCKSPAGALYDRLTTPGAAEWLATENWPWSSQAAAAAAESDPYPVGKSTLPTAAQEAERTRASLQELDRLIAQHGEQLDRMTSDELQDLIATSTLGTEGSRAQTEKLVSSKGRDSPLVHRTLLEMLDAVKKH